MQYNTNRPARVVNLYCLANCEPNSACGPEFDSYFLMTTTFNLAGTHIKLQHWQRQLPVRLLLRLFQVGSTSHHRCHEPGQIYMALLTRNGISRYLCNFNWIATPIHSFPKPVLKTRSAACFWSVAGTQVEPRYNPCRHRKNIQTLHSKVLVWVSNLQTYCCEATVLTTA